MRTSTLFLGDERIMIRAIAAVARADLRERSRSTKIVLVPVLVAYFAKVVTVDTTLVVAGEYTGEPTVAWFAGMTTVIGTTIFFLFGFSLVKGSVIRDRETGVGELIAPSSLSNHQYLLGKWLSNFVVLTIATAVLLVSTAIAYSLQETGGFGIWALVSPFLLITIPTMMVVAAAAVCFETIGPLRGTAGTVVYFFVAVIVLTVGIAPSTPFDFTGLVLVRESMLQSISIQYPGFDSTALAFAYTDGAGSTQPFYWNGITWTLSRLATRLPIVGVAVGLLGIATAAFSRFDDSTRWSFPVRRNNRSEGSDRAESSLETSPTSSLQSSSFDVELASVTSGGFSFGRLYLAELRMALRRRSRWWYVACLTAFVVAAVAPVNVVRTVVVPIALLLPLSTWSSLGARERLHRTEELVFVSSHPVRLLGATYGTGLIVGVILTLPAPIRFAASGIYGALFGWIVGILFLPAAALAMGIWVGRPKVFEIAYLTAWYLGPMNELVLLDYLGVWRTTVSNNITLGYLVLTIVALVMAIIGRIDSMRTDERHFVR